MAASIRDKTKGAGRRLRDAARTITASGPPQAFEAGQFYSPIPDAATLLGSERDRVWPAQPPDPAGVDCAPQRQALIVAALGDIPTAQWGSGSGHYDPDNDQFPPQDAAVLYAMVRTLRPRRMIEIGCGWSTTVTAQALRDGEIDCNLTCIEPYPREFLATIREVDRLVVQQVEHVPLDTFDALEAGDVLFIDTSHVVKTGSDVVHLVLEVLPRLADGVIVHIHDIFMPFDYPAGWIEAGFGWNEQYLVQAFLSGHERARMLMMNRWASARLSDELVQAGLPVADGSSIWFVLGDVPAAFGLD